MTKKIKSNYYLLFSFFALFIIALIYSILAICYGKMASAQGSLVVIMFVLNSIGLLLPFFMEKFLNIQTSFSFRISLYIFMSLGYVFGETFEFYYLFPWWDDLLHTLSGIGITLIGFCLAKQILKNTNLNHINAICIIIGILFSFSIAYIWELLEFSCDAIFGTNMQKFIPEDSSIFNGGSSFDSLFGTNEEIAEFFRSPEGYKYALMDTMTDLIDCFLGSIIFVLSFLIYERKNDNALENIIVLNSNKNEETVQNQILD